MGTAASACSVHLSDACIVFSPPLKATVGAEVYPEPPSVTVNANSETVPPAIDGVIVVPVPPPPPPDIVTSGKSLAK